MAELWRLNDSKLPFKCLDERFLFTDLLPLLVSTLPVVTGTFYI